MADLPQHPDPSDPRRGSETFESAATQDADIVDLHKQLMREKGEPTERFLPTPLYLVMIIAALSFWAGIYLIENSGDFQWYIYDENLKPGAMAAASGPVVFDPLVAGKRFYSRNCQVCHQADGNGVPGAFPPLANSDWVKSNPEKLVKILLHGMGGPIVVNGNQYNGAMPAFNTNSDRDIAAVLTYLRSSPDMGNNAPEITEEQVAEVRAAHEGRSAPWDGPEIMRLYGLGPQG